MILLRFEMLPRMLKLLPAELLIMFLLMKMRKMMEPMEVKMMTLTEILPPGLSMYPLIMASF